MNLDFRAHDSHEHGLTLTEAEAFEAAERRLRSRP